MYEIAFRIVLEQKEIQSNRSLFSVDSWKSFPFWFYFISNFFTQFRSASAWELVLIDFLLIYNFSAVCVRLFMAESTMFHQFFCSTLTMHDDDLYLIKIHRNMTFCFVL